LNYDDGTDRRYEVVAGELVEMGSIPFLQKYLAIEIAATQTMSACADCLKTLALRV
jgi:hypothetical protein